MTVDCMGFVKMDDQIAIQEAATAGLKSLEHLILQLSRHQSQIQIHHQPLDCREIADHTVSKFKKMISILDRTGHARFRRGPTPAPAPAPAPVPQDLHPPPPPLPPPKSITLDFTKPDSAPCPLDFTKESSSISPPISLSSGSSITGDGSVSNGRQGPGPGPSVLLPPVAPVSAGKPPLSSSYKKRCLGHSEAVADGGRCHCPKRKKSRVKRAIRVPAVGGKVADVPADEHSWRKYGQKPIKGSPYPRGYYKCSSVKGCPAKKHVERAPDDPAMLIITYEGEHTHNHHPLLSDTIIIHAS